MNRLKKLLGNGIRVLTLMVCVLVLGVSISRAQVRPPGGIGGGPPPGGIGGKFPPGGIGGVPQPGGIVGGPQPGGIGGKLPPGGIGGMPQPGGVVGGPQPGGIGGKLPPGGIGGMPQPGGIGGGVGGGKVWICEKCGRELSRGNNPPIGMTCPGCGVRITGAIDGPGAGGMGGGPPPGGMGGGGGQAPNPVKAPNIRNGGPDNPDIPPKAEVRQGMNAGLKLLLLLGGLFIGVLFLGACAFGFILLTVFYSRSQEGA